ncbi:hypothetical protein [Alicyclobacillus ferrooxydans]|nr:hypothetical protein [Alicyclobacillus ferrooxydans]
MNQMNVFVYGTLRKHDSNHGLLAAAEPVAMQCRVPESMSSIVAMI